MNTPKPIQDLRIQTLQGNSPSTPLRRRSGLNTTNVTLHSSASLNDSKNARQINDDDEERRNSRRIDGPDSATNLNETADSLTNCLKLFKENKISKDNAWTLNIIDYFSKLIKKHHSSLANFQLAGSSLEASTKVYSLRVDSVYADVLRMSTDLSKQTAKALNKKNRLDLDDEESDKGEDGNDKENMDANQGEAGNKSPKAKSKAKKRRHVATVTKNPDTLNGRLETLPLIDPFFAKLNSMIGDINSSKRLMQHILPTRESNLKLCQNMQIWYKNDHEVNLEEKIDYKAPNQDLSLATVTSVIGKFDNNSLRNGLKSYRICDLPMENAEEADMSIRQQNESNFINQTILGGNASNMDLQFDINAEVEPIPTERSFVMDFGDMDDHDFIDVEEEQRIALNRCKGLKRQPILIEDMQPETSAVVSDYSYRPLDMIDQFWAGPSHWKFRQSRRTNLALRASQASINNVSEVQVIGQKPKAIRKKKIIRRSEVSLEDALNADDFDTLFAQKGKSKNTQITVQVMAKRWDNKKLKLPNDHRIASDIFDMFAHTKTIHIATNPDATFTGTDNGDNYNYDNEDDRNYCSRVADIQSDTETETNTDMGQMDNNMEFDMGDMAAPQLPIPQIDEIPDFFVGAPDRIEKISIAFARRAKVVDMKQLKQCSWNLISRKQATDPLNSPCFSEILRDLPKILTKTMADNMSMPLAFYAILHLCNDKGLLLKPNEDLKDFEINFVN